MKILTQPGRLDQSQQHTYQVDEDNSLSQKYDGIGYRKNERTYQVTYRHHVYTIICPEYRKETDIVLIIPEFLLPGRPYPIYVYLYAIDDYSKNPNTSQRQSAEATRKHFGLETFAHTTLGRFLKRFVKKHISETEDNNTSEASQEQAGESQQSREYDPTGGDTAEPTNMDCVEGYQLADILQLEDKAQPTPLDNTKAASTPAAKEIPRHFPSRQATEQAREQTAQIFHKYNFPNKETPFLEACHTLVNKIFREYERLLI